MAPRDIHQTDSRHLAKMMELSTETQRLWRPEEFGAILRHQLNAPLDYDLNTVDPGMTAKLQTWSTAGGQPLTTFGDLLRHPRPPLQLLEYLKQFGKTHRNDPESPLPRDIATLLYYAGIVVALIRCRRRITQLDDHSLRRGIEWAIAQPWVEESTRSIFREGLAFIVAHGSEATQ